MSATATPYGLRPVNLIGGRYNAGAFRKIPIASAYDTSIFAGDMVKIVAGGGVEKDLGTNAATPVGVFIGCEFTDPNSNHWLQRQYWPADTVATDAYAFVVDDPDAIFQIQADGAVQAADVGQNAEIVQTAGTAAIGNSKNAMNATTAATATFPLRIIGFAQSPDNAAGDAFTDCLVKFVVHQYNTALGV